MPLFIAKLKTARGRFLLSGERGQGGFDGWKIHDARQEKYGNKPDAETGLYLNEMQMSVSESDISSIKEFTPPTKTKPSDVLKNVPMKAVRRGVALGVEAANWAVEQGACWIAICSTQADAEKIARCCNSNADLLAALQAVASAHARVETCDMPMWLEMVEAAIDKATAN